MVDWTVEKPRTGMYQHLALLVFWKRNSVSEHTFSYARIHHLSTIPLLSSRKLATRPQNFLQTFHPVLIYIVGISLSWHKENYTQIFGLAMDSPSWDIVWTDRPYRLKYNKLHRYRERKYTNYSFIDYTTPGGQQSYYHTIMSDFDIQSHKDANHAGHATKDHLKKTWKRIYLDSPTIRTDSVESYYHTGRGRLRNVWAGRNFETDHPTSNSVQLVRQVAFLTPASVSAGGRKSK